MLKEFYYRYESSLDKGKLNNEKLNLLLEFQAYLFDKGFIDRNKLRFHGTRLIQTEENLRYFHFRLLAFFLHHVNSEAIANTEPFLSIQMYFVLGVLCIWGRKPVKWAVLAIFEPTYRLLLGNLLHI